MGAHCLEVEFSGIQQWRAFNISEENKCHRYYIGYHLFHIKLVILAIKSCRLKDCIPKYARWMYLFLVCLWIGRHISILHITFCFWYHFKGRNIYFFVWWMDMWQVYLDNVCIIFIAEIATKSENIPLVRFILLGYLSTFYQIYYIGFWNPI